MNQLIGRDVRTAFDVDRVAAAAALDVDLAAAQARGLDARPDVREARLKLRQAEFDRESKKAERMPDVSLAVSYSSNLNIDVLPRNLATLGVQVTWEPFDWGRHGRELAGKSASRPCGRERIRSRSSPACGRKSARSSPTFAASTSMRRRAARKCRCSRSRRSSTRRGPRSCSAATSSAR